MLPANQYVARLKKETISIGEQKELKREMENGLVKGIIVLKGHMWVLVNPILQLVLFDYSPSKATVNAVLILKNYKGLLMTDAYSGYIRLAKLMGINITLLSCWAHCRRRFLESQNPDNPDQVIKEIIQFCSDVFFNGMLPDA